MFLALASFSMLLVPGTAILMSHAQTPQTGHGGISSNAQLPQVPSVRCPQHLLHHRHLHPACPCAALFPLLWTRAPPSGCFSTTTRRLWEPFHSALSLGRTSGSAWRPRPLASSLTCPFPGCSHVVSSPSYPCHPLPDIKLLPVPKPCSLPSSLLFLCTVVLLPSS